MFPDILSLQKFYQTRLGEKTQQLLNLRLAQIWPNLKGDAVLALGYGAPLLQALARRTSLLYAFMPAGQGAAAWPAHGQNVACLVDPEALPLPDQSISRAVMLHMLEGASDPEGALGEIWRVMKGEGKLVVIVPNRMGLWTHSEETPFGTGHPYSAAQIKSLLQNQGFVVEQTHHALYMPPLKSKLCLMLGLRIEKIAARFFPAFGGVLMIEASKQFHAPITAGKKTQRLVLPLPFPTAPLLPT